MLKRFLPRQSAPTVHLRQASGSLPPARPEELMVVAPRNDAVTMVANDDGAADADANADAGMASDAAAPSANGVRITAASQLPEWRSLIQEVVTKSDQQSCAVLDLHMRLVLVLCTPEYYSSSAHTALMHTLARAGWSVRDQLTCSPQVIAEVRMRDSQKRPGSTDGDQQNVQLYKDIMASAQSLKASDIHVRLNSQSRSIVRLRIDGKLRAPRYFDTTILENALSAGYNSLTIKGTNTSPAWTTERPINTMTRFMNGTAPLHGRMSTHPVTAGCKVVIRVLDASQEYWQESSLSKLGFTEQQLDEELMPALSRTKGFILVSGSTGDGKTTTVQHMLVSLPDRDEKSLVGVEDPNENEVPGMDHISLQRSPDDTQTQMRLKFDAALLQMLRLDPDVIFQGEVRDKVSGEFASDAVMTGHLWIGTVHGNSAIDAILRLVGDKIGIDPDVLGGDGNFVASLSQKLVPLLCPHCKVPATQVMAPSDLHVLRQKFHLDPSTMFCANDSGCEHCKPAPDLAGDGEKGRMAAVEIVANPSAELLACIRERDLSGATLAWRRTRRAPFHSPDMRGKTSYEVALYLVSQGLVSPLTLQKVFGVHFAAVEVLGVISPVKEVA